MSSNQITAWNSNSSSVSGSQSKVYHMRSQQISNAGLSHRFGCVHVCQYPRTWDYTYTKEHLDIDSVWIIRDKISNNSHLPNDTTSRHRGCPLPPHTPLGQHFYRKTWRVSFSFIHIPWIIQMWIFRFQWELPGHIPSRIFTSYHVTDNQSHIYYAPIYTSNFHIFYPGPICDWAVWVMW